MHNYVSANMLFPNAGWAYTDPVTGVADYPNDYSPLAKLLPYCEQQNLQDLVDFSVYMGHIGRAALPAELQPAAATVVPMFICPSDPEEPVHELTYASTPLPYAGTNYAMNQGSGMDEAYHPGFGASNGLCWIDARIAFRDIKDGTTQTVAFAESLRGPCDSPAAGSVPDIQVYRAQTASSNAPAAEAGGLDAILSSISGWDGTRLSMWLRGCAPQGPVMNGRFTPNCPWPDLTYRSDKVTAARSWHPGGVNICLCDGSVRFITDSIDADVWHAIWTRDGGEIVSGNAY